MPTQDTDTRSLDELTELQLAKVRLEKAELEQRIKNSETPHERRFKLGVAALVPLITACIALLAAYVELRRVQDAKQELERETRKFEQLKTADFQKIKAERAVSLLANPTSPSTPHVVLPAIREILLSGAPATPGLVNAVTALIGHADISVSDTAAELLTRLDKADLVGPAIAGRLYEIRGPERLPLLRVLMALPADQIETDLSRLLSSTDPIVAGAAGLALAAAKQLSWARIDLTDASKSSETIESQINVVLLQQNGPVRAQALSGPLANLLQKERAPLTSPAGRAACYFLSSREIPQNADELRERLKQPTDVDISNRILLQAALGKETDKQEVVRVFNTLINKPIELKNIDRGIINAVQKRFALNDEMRKISYKDDYIQGLPTEPAKAQNWAAHLDWTSVPTEVLKTWSRDRPEGVDNLTVFRNRARDQLFERNSNDALQYFESIGLPPKTVVGYWAQTPAKRERYLKYLAEIKASPPGGNSFPKEMELSRAVSLIRDETLAVDVFDKYPDSFLSPFWRFEFLPNALPKTLIAKILERFKETGRSTAGLFVMLGEETGGDLGPWLSAAALSMVESLEVTDWRQYPRKVQSEIGFLHALVVISLVKDKGLRVDLSKRLARILSGLPTQAIGEMEPYLSEKHSTFRINDRVFAAVFAERLPGFMDRQSASYCGLQQATFDPILAKVVLAKYALGLD